MIFLTPRALSFLSVLSAYAVFLGPMIGLLCTHFYIIQKRRFAIPDLYEGSSKSAYWFTYGVNWRTVVAWVCAVLPRYAPLNYWMNCSLADAYKQHAWLRPLGQSLVESQSWCHPHLQSELCPRLLSRSVPSILSPVSNQ